MHEVWQQSIRSPLDMDPFHAAFLYRIRNDIVYDTVTGRILLFHLAWTVPGLAVCDSKSVPCPFALILGAGFFLCRGLPVRGSLRDRRQARH